MDFEEVFRKERATRKFTNRKVNEKLLKKVVEEAQHSPSLLNSQPWRVYVITGENLNELRHDQKEAIEAGKRPREDFADMLSLEWDLFPSSNMATMGASQTYFFRNKLHLFNDANKEMFNAPAIVYLTLPKKSPAWSVFDLGIFAQSLMLVAINNGLSTMPAHSLVSYPELIHKYAEVPDDELIGMAIALGYPDRSAEVNDPKFYPKRVPFNKIFHITR